MRFDLRRVVAQSRQPDKRVAAVRAGAPKARIIVDANESWGALDIAAEAEILKTLGVAMIEQPLPAGQDAALANLSAPLPIFADESCHVAADVPRLAGLYQGVNIKLDKAGGLTEGVALLAAAKDAGLQSMVGCMLSTSLGIRPAFVLAQSVQWVDLDGPALLSGDASSAGRPGYLLVWLLNRRYSGSGALAYICPSLRLNVALIGLCVEAPGLCA